MERTIYRIVKYKDDTYQVQDIDTDEVYYQGTLSDCNAWIQLTEDGHIF